MQIQIKFKIQGMYRSCLHATKKSLQTENYSRATRLENVFHCHPAVTLADPRGAGGLVNNLPKDFSKIMQFSGNCKEKFFVLSCWAPLTQILDPPLTASEAHNKRNTDVPLTCVVNSKALRAVSQ